MILVSVYNFPMLRNLCMLSKVILSVGNIRPCAYLLKSNLLRDVTGPFWLYKVEDDHVSYMRGLMHV